MLTVLPARKAAPAAAGTPKKGIRRSTPAASAGSIGSGRYASRKTTASSQRRQHADGELAAHVRADRAFDPAPHVAGARPLRRRHQRQPEPFERLAAGAPVSADRDHDDDPRRDVDGVAREAQRLVEQQGGARAADGVIQRRRGRQAAEQQRGERRGTRRPAGGADRTRRSAARRRRRARAERRARPGRRRPRTGSDRARS